MAQRDWKEIQAEADALSAEEQILLANYLLSKAKSRLKATGNLHEFRGAIKLSIDPCEFQKSIRAEWP